MVEELERIYTIPLREVYTRGSHETRAKRASKILRSFISRHMKASEEQVKIDNDVNSLVWAKGIQKPPRKIKVRAKKDKDGNVEVSLIEKVEERKKEAKKSGSEVKPTAQEKKPATQTAKPEPPKQTQPETKIETPKKPTQQTETTKLETPTRAQPEPLKQSQPAAKPETPKK